VSETKFPSKKAIPIIVVTWILSLATTLAVVYVVPNILRPTWHEVARFSGTLEELDRDDDNNFYISSNHWRLYWEVNCEEESLPADVEFRLFLWGESNYPLTQITWLTQSDFKRSIGQEYWSSLRDKTEYITGSGVFDLAIVGARLDWEIIVEAYY